MLLPIPDSKILPSAWGETGHLEMCPESPPKNCPESPLIDAIFKIYLFFGNHQTFLDENYEENTGKIPLMILLTYKPVAKITWKIFDEDYRCQKFP